MSFPVFNNSHLQQQIRRHGTIYFSNGNRLDCEMSLIVTNDNFYSHKYMNNQPYYQTGPATIEFKIFTQNNPNNQFTLKMLFDGYKHDGTYDAGDYGFTFNGLLITNYHMDMYGGVEFEGTLDHYVTPAIDTVAIKRRKKLCRILGEEDELKKID